MNSRPRLTAAQDKRMQELCKLPTEELLKKIKADKRVARLFAN